MGDGSSIGRGRHSSLWACATARRTAAFCSNAFETSHKPDTLLLLRVRGAGLEARIARPFLTQMDLWGRNGVKGSEREEWRKG